MKIIKNTNLDRLAISEVHLPSTSSGFLQEPADWQKVGEAQAMQTFRLAAARVPAYQHFLKRHRINPESIKKIQDFAGLPITSKENYILKYPFYERCIDGDPTAGNVISTSSGSTGQPQFWLRNQTTNQEVEWIFEIMFRNSFQVHQKKTLLIMAFSLGTWTAGTCVLGAVVALADKGYPLAVVSPGIDKAGILRSAQELSSAYEQTIICCYPPFGKDVIDEGIALGIDWKKLNIKFLWGGEGVTESWRDYILEKVGQDNPLLSTFNFYGSADGVDLGFETPVAIAVSRLAHRDVELSQALFSGERSPWLYQYNPAFKHFESVGGDLVITGPGAMPLVRYNTHDQGSLIEAGQMQELLAEHGVNLNEELERYEAADLNYRLPFVYLFGRPHNNATIYGVNIYPENIKAVLEDPEIRNLFTGRFKMSTELTEDMDQYLLLRLELGRQIDASAQLQERTLELIKTRLVAVNSEYSKLFATIGERAVPRLELLLAGDPLFTPGGIKYTTAVK